MCENVTPTAGPKAGPIREVQSWIANAKHPHLEAVLLELFDADHVSIDAFWGAVDEVVQ